MGPAKLLVYRAAAMGQAGAYLGTQGCKLLSCRHLKCSEMCVCCRAVAAGGFMQGFDYLAWSVVGLQV